MGTNIVSSRGCDELLDTIPFTSMAVHAREIEGRFLGWVGVALSRKITKYEILHWVSADGSKIRIKSLITAWEGKTIVNSTTTCQLEE